MPIVRLCARCSQIAPRGQRYCPTHRALERQRKQHKKIAAGYNLRHWRRLSSSLLRHGQCARCRAGDCYSR
jgi:hypothetical protein